MSASRLLRLTVSGALLGWIGWQTDWGRVARALSSMRGELWLAAFGLLLATQLVSAVRWSLFARALHFTPHRTRLIGFYFIGMFFNLVLPTSVGGDVVRAWYLDGNSGRKLAAFASVILDRLNGLIVLVALACTAVAVSPIALPPWMPISAWSVAVCGILALTALALVVHSGRLPEQRVRQLQPVLYLLKAPRPFLGATVLSMVVQISNVAIVWLIGTGLGAPIPASYYWIMVPMVSLLTLVPISINGMGVREGGMLLFLTPLGVDQATALTLAFLWFLVQTAGGLLGGLVYLAGAFPKPVAAALAHRGEEQIAYGPIAGDSDQGRTGQLDPAA